MTLHRDQRLNLRAGGTPGREVGHLTIVEAAPDQQAARPQAAIWRIKLGGVEISQFEVSLVSSIHLAAPDGTFASLAQSYSRGPLVPSPADRRRHADGFSPRAIAATVPRTNGLRPHG
jgi:hypothetical protein